MIFSKPLCLTIACLLSTAFGGAYEINIGGQTFQVNVMDEAGHNYQDRNGKTDDYGEPLDPQKNAICSSLRGEYCASVTNNGAKTHNLFNYFPNHADESVVAHANKRYRKDESAHSLKQPMDDRTLAYLSKQNIHTMGTKPLPAAKPKQQSTAQQPSLGGVGGIASTLFDDNGLFSTDAMKLVKTKTIKTKKKIKKKETTVNTPSAVDKTTNGQSTNTIESSNQEQLTTADDTAVTVAGSEEQTTADGNAEYEEVEIEFYSNFEDAEMGDTVDQVIAQLIASYMDGESGDEMDLTQLLANGMDLEVMDLDESTMSEMNDLLNALTGTGNNKPKSETGMDENGLLDLDAEKADSDDDEIKMFAFKFTMDAPDSEKADEDKENNRVKDTENEKKNEQVIAV